MAEFRYAQTNLQLFDQLRAAGFTEAERARVSAAYDLAMRLFTGQFRCSGKTFLAHLVGTASILARYGAPEPVVSAALLHAAYDEGDFGSIWPGMTAAKRATVRAAVGEEGEHLVAAYNALSWRAADRPGFLGRLDRLTEAERTAAFMRVANELEELLDGGFLYCSERRQEDMAASIAACGTVCRALDLPEIWAEMEETYGRYRATAPAAANAPRHGAYRLPAASLAMRPGLRLWRLIRRPWRALTPGTLRARVRGLVRGAG